VEGLKNTKTMFIGFILIIMGGIMFMLSSMFGGTDFQDFLSGLMLGISIPSHVPARNGTGLS